MNQFGFGKRADLSRAAFGLDALESRQLMSGVTLVTHGFEWDNNTANLAWADSMASSIMVRAGADSVGYVATVGTSGQVTMTHVLGPTLDSSSNGEVVILLDWSAVSNTVFHPLTDTAYIADVVAPIFTQTFPDSGITRPLAQLPVHLIGHSRGGSVVSEIADRLGRAGIWVDQVTTIDPHPVTLVGDPIADPTANVIFADNYYQTAVWPGGSQLAGAFNTLLNSVAPDHSQTHEWYSATIPTGASSTGYAYSRIAGGARPDDGLNVAFGGSGSRYAVSSQSGPQWPNITDLGLDQTGNVFQAGQPLTANFTRQDVDSSATVTLFFDNDLNPDDTGTYYTLADNVSIAASTDIFTTSNVSLATTGVAAGQYFLMARITDGQNTRFAYSRTPITITPAPVNAPDLSGTLTGVAGTLPIGGKNNHATLRISNTGNRSATGNVVVRLYASADAALDDSDILIGAYTQKLNLATGKSVLSTLAFNSPANVPDGRYRLLAVIDATGRIAERAEYNNVAVSNSATMIRQPYVDPKPVSYVFPSTMKRGSRRTATVWVQNSGSVSANGTYTLRLYLSPDTTGVGAIVLGMLTSKMTLLPGKKTPMTITFTVPNGATSGWYLAATLDFKGTPGDRDTSNNVFFDDTTVAVA